MEQLNEVKRNQLVSQSRRNVRYQKRLRCKIPTGSKAFDELDVNDLFKNDRLTTTINIIGETDNYDVTISFTGVIGFMKELIKETGRLDLGVVVRACVRAFDRNDVYVHCACPDFKFRFRYWATIERYNSGEIEMRPTNITNPHGDLGSCCKHCLLLLNNHSWMLKTASVINNYIRVLRVRNNRLYKKVIEPVLFGDDMVEVPTEERPKAVQTSLFDKPEVEEPKKVVGPPPIPDEENEQEGEQDNGNTTNQENK